MTGVQFLSRLSAQVLVGDAAMGTALHDRGLPAGDCPDAWNVARPNEVLAVHHACVQAGAGVLVTNTFGGTRRRLERHRLGDCVAKLNATGVRLAVRAGGRKRLVAASVGPTGCFPRSPGGPSSAEVEALFREQVQALAAAGPDLFLLETFYSLEEAALAIPVALETGLAVVCTFAFDAAGHTLQGIGAAEVARSLSALGVSALGANCGAGPKTILPVVAGMARATDLPLVAQPSAGLPRWAGDRAVYDLPAEEMGEWARRFVEQGARWIGGCCGTRPEHVRAVAAAVDSSAGTRNTRYTARKKVA